MCVAFQGQFAKSDNETRAGAHDQSDSNDTRRADECQFPVLDVCNHKCSDKGSQCCNDQSHLFGNAILYKIGVGCDTSRDFASAYIIKVANVLSHDCLQISLADLLSDVLPGIYEPNGRDVDGNEFANSDVDEVKYVLDKFMMKGFVVECI